MKLPVIYVYTHDSIGVGEDGPTHQPVEHISMLRITPGIYTWRPCDGVETACAWKFALESKSAPSKEGRLISYTRDISTPGVQ